MLSATFSEIFSPGTPSVMVKRETVSDEEIEVGKESDMEESVSPVQEQPEDLSVPRKGGGEEARGSRSDSPRPSSGSPTRRSSSSGSPDSGKAGEQSRAKRIKPIPPPLDLNARTLSPSDILPHQPQSPADIPRESLPLRKRSVQCPGRRRIDQDQPCHVVSLASTGKLIYFHCFSSVHLALNKVIK